MGACLPVLILVPAYLAGCEIRYPVPSLVAPYTHLLKHRYAAWYVFFDYFFNIYFLKHSLRTLGPFVGLWYTLVRILFYPNEDWSSRDQE